ncbi:MAG: NAD(P)H-dependent oxidoreductase [Clostridiaceae bacterium]
MKIAVIHGQSHKGSTYNIAKLFIDRLATSEDEVSEFQTNNISSCIGCYTCVLKSEEMCPHSKEVQPIIEAIESADVVIAESPNYCMGMSGQLKTFFDHMAYRWISHRPHPSMNNKIGIAISTTAGVGASGTAKSIKKHMFWWGISKIYTVSEAVAAMNWNGVKPEKKEKIVKKADEISKKILKKEGKVNPGLKWKIMFNIMRMQQKNNPWNPADRKHWEDNGWIYQEKENKIFQVDKEELEIFEKEFSYKEKRVTDT